MIWLLSKLKTNKHKKGKHKNGRYENGNYKKGNYEKGNHQNINYSPEITQHLRPSPRLHHRIGRHMGRMYKRPKRHATSWAIVGIIMLLSSGESIIINCFS